PLPGPAAAFTNTVKQVPRKSLPVRFEWPCIGQTGPTAQLGQDSRPPERLFSTQSIAFLATALFERMSVTFFSLSMPALAPTETPPMRMRSVIVSPLVRFSKPIVPSAKPPPTSMTSESPPTLNEFTHQSG